MMQQLFLAPLPSGPSIRTVYPILLQYSSCTRSWSQTCFHVINSRYQQENDNGQYHTASNSIRYCCYSCALQGAVHAAKYQCHSNVSTILCLIILWNLNGKSKPKRQKQHES